MRHILFFSPANMNLMSGSAVWTQSTAEVLSRLPNVQVTMLLKSPPHRSLLLNPLRRIKNIDIVDPRKFTAYVPNMGISNEAALDYIAQLDDRYRFDDIVVRGFSASLAATWRGRYENRLWSTYVLEPERNVHDQSYLADLRAISKRSRYLLVQSEPMRAILEVQVPEARGKTLLLPPAVPASKAPPVFGATSTRNTRLIYAGKYHPFYCVPELLDQFSLLRMAHPNLEFHLFGDQVSMGPELQDWAIRLKTAVESPGVEWHGAIAREELIEDLRLGGIALSIWDHRHGSAMNDLVVSTKLLDYCNAGLPVILTRTPIQEEILGSDYPLFVDQPSEVGKVIAMLLNNPEIQRDAARRCWDAGQKFTYDSIAKQLASSTLEHGAIASTLAAREKLDGAGWRIGIPLESLNTSDASRLMEQSIEMLLREPRAHVTVGIRGEPGAEDPSPGNDLHGRFREYIAVGFEDRFTFQTVTDPWNWWRLNGVLYAPLGFSIDRNNASIGLASGARSVEQLSEVFLDVQ